jgi:hypothetical protein
MIIPIYQDHLVTTLTQYPTYLKSSLSTSHIFKLQLCCLSKMWYISILGLCSIFVVLLYSTPHYMSILHVSNGILYHIPKYHPFIFNLVITYSWSHVLQYSICKWVDWVMQLFTNLCPMPKCNLYYLWLIVVTLIQ